MSRPRFALSVAFLSIVLVANRGTAQTPSGSAPVLDESVQLLGVDLETEAALRRAAGTGVPASTSPFAVSSAGRAVPRERREVTVLGADPAIAAGLSRRPVATEATRTAPREPTTSPAAPRAATTVERDPAQQPTPARPAATTSDRDPAEQSTPARPVATAASRDAPPTRPAEAPRGTLHRVERGETLWAIARRYDVSPESIREANDLGDERLRPDQVLVIPVVGR